MELNSFSPIEPKLDMEQNLKSKLFNFNCTWLEMIPTTSNEL